MTVRKFQKASKEEKLNFMIRLITKYNSIDINSKEGWLISEDANGVVSVTVQDVVRSGYIVLMFVIFLLSIILVAGKQGIKAILGLIITILAIYFILIKGIYSRSRCNYIFNFNINDCNSFNFYYNRRY